MPLPSTPSARRSRTWRRVGRVRTVASAKARSTTAASVMRTALNASGGSWRVAYFTTGKLNPQMATISSIRRSVGTNIGAGRADESARGRASMSVMRKASVRGAGLQRVAPVEGAIYVVGMHLSFALFADAANISQEGKRNVLGAFEAVQRGGRRA